MSRDWNLLQHDLDLPTPQDSSHHQEYHIFTRGSQPKPSFNHYYWVDPKQGLIAGLTKGNQWWISRLIIGLISGGGRLGGVLLTSPSLGFAISQIFRNPRWRPVGPWLFSESTNSIEGVYTTQWHRYNHKQLYSSRQKKSLHLILKPYHLHFETRLKKYVRPANLCRKQQDVSGCVLGGSFSILATCCDIQVFENLLVAWDWIFPRSWRWLYDFP